MNPSLWLSQERKKNYPSMKEEAYYDCVIVGAGLTGLTSAYYLKDSHLKIAVIEANEIGSGASGRSTGKLSAQHDDCYQKIASIYDKKMAKQFYLDQKKAIHNIESIIQTNQINCNFERCDSILYAETKEYISKLKNEKEYYEQFEIPHSFQSIPTFPKQALASLSMKHQARFNPVSYLYGISDLLDQYNIPIFEHSVVTNVLTQEDHSILLLVNHIKIHAKKVILATQYPIIDQGNFYFLRLIAKQASVLSYQSTHKMKHMYINLDDITHSYSQWKDQWLICGNTHRVGIYDHADLDELKQHALLTFPVHELTYSWSTSDYISMDEMPLIGELNKDSNIYFASGYCKWGNATSHIAAELLSNLILNKEDERSKRYDPHRHIPYIKSTFLKDNIKTAFELIKGRIMTPDITLPEKGHASSVLIDQHHYGIYHHDTDEIFIVDLVCPHLGCICKFNDEEKTWDCPCHGSRYNYDGTLLKGPSTKPLCEYKKGMNQIDPHLIKE